uniref:Placenta associated 9 n=1 Tax=Sus scrofa TaxID=9823 RepID=A0A8D1AQ37_PIG
MTTGLRDKGVIGAAPHLYADPPCAFLCLSLDSFQEPPLLSPVLCRSLQCYRESEAAEPFIPSGGDSSRSTACDRYMAIHSRLNVIEETVEKTVEHLEAEVKGLLGQLEELAWNLPPGPFSPIPDLLGDGDSS